MSKKIVSLTLAFLLSFSTFAYAGINALPAVDEMIVSKDHDGINAFINNDTRGQIEKTVSTVVEIDENNIINPAYEEILGHGTESFKYMDELALDANGDLTEEYKKLCEEDFYENPCARIGGGQHNMYSMVGQIGPQGSRPIATWLLDEEETAMFHPEAVHTCSYGKTGPTYICGTVEWIRIMLEQNPDTAFIFCVSVTHDTTENIINFARFCFDDPEESYWGKLRDSYGLDKLNVLAFELGNETYINSTAYPAQYSLDRVEWYANKCIEVIDAVHEVFPDLALAPSFGADYDELIPGDDYGRFRQRWTRPLLEKLPREKIKYLGFHLYYGGYEPAYCCKAYDYMDEILTDLYGENHGIQLLVTEHSKWVSGTQWSTAATMTSALTTAQYLNYLYAIPNQLVRAANYYAFTSETIWALMRRCYDGTLVTSGVGKMYEVFQDGLGDRVVSTTSIPQDDSGLCDKSDTRAMFSVQAYAEGNKKLKIIMTNREEHTAVDVNFNYLKNKYKLVGETVFTSPNSLSFVYDKNSKDIFTVTKTSKNESDFSHYVMPNHSMVVLELESMTGSIPQFGETGSGQDGIIVYEGEPHFTDIEYHWANAEINLLAEDKLISGNGDGTFAPDVKISNGEFSAMICKLMGTDSVSSSNITDIFPDNWYYDYVNTVINRGYINISDGKFNPEGEMTLKDALIMLYRVCLTKKNDVKVENATDVVDGIGINTFLTDWETEAMAYILKNGFITEFYEVSDMGLTEGITRAQAAALIYRLKTHLGVTVDTESGEV